MLFDDLSFGLNELHSSVALSPPDFQSVVESWNKHSNITSHQFYVTGTNTNTEFSDDWLNEDVLAHPAMATLTHGKTGSVGFALPISPNVATEQVSPGGSLESNLLAKLPTESSCLAFNIPGNASPQSVFTAETIDVEVRN